MGELAERVVEAIQAREWLLGTVEIGGDGAISRRIFNTDVGPDLLGNSLILEDINEAIILMDLPRPQFRNKGDFSAKAARAAAREGLGFLGVQACIVLWGLDEEAEEDDICAYVAFGTSRNVVAEPVRARDVAGTALDGIVDRALALADRELQEG